MVKGHMYDLEGYIREHFGELDETEKTYKRNYEETPSCALTFPMTRRSF